MLELVRPGSFEILHSATPLTDAIANRIVGSEKLKCYRLVRR